MTQARMPCHCSRCSALVVNAAKTQHRGPMSEAMLKAFDTKAPEEIVVVPKSMNQVDDIKKKQIEQRRVWSIKAKHKRARHRAAALA